MNDARKSLLMWHMHLRVMANPLRLRYTMERADRARAAAKLKEYLLTQRLLRFAQH